MAETQNNRWAKGASRAKYTVRHYGRNYSVITEQSECGRLRFYATIESLYGANRFTETVRKRNGNFSMTPTVYAGYLRNFHQSCVNLYFR